MDVPQLLDAVVGRPAVPAGQQALADALAFGTERLQPVGPQIRQQRPGVGEGGNGHLVQDRRSRRPSARDQGPAALRVDRAIWGGAPEWLEGDARA